MLKFGRFIAKNRVLVLIVAVLLLIPSVYGLIKTRINYDILTYLPEDLDSMKGQRILNDVFSNAATGMLMIENMEPKDVVKIKEKISQIDGVEKVFWISDFLDESIPKEILPSEIKDMFFRENSTLLTIQFENEAASDETQKAIEDIRKVLNKQCFLSGMSAIVKDTIDLADRETPIYVLLAVVLAVIVLALTLESTIIPIIFLLAIGIAIVYNFGTNTFLGEISYITKSLAAVLQLGVTMDYSIFLLHRYEDELKHTTDKNEAMAIAISKTAASILGSSLTTIAGFLALVAMQLGLGKDIGIVMAKGVFIGVIATVTILPALILTFDKVIHRFNHGTVLPEFNKLSSVVTRYYKVFIVVIIILFIPSLYGKNNTQVYYNLDESLPKDMESIVALNKLKDEYNMTTTHMIIVKEDIPTFKVKEMIEEIERVDGIEKVIGYDKILGPAIPEEFIPKEIKEQFVKDGYKLILANSIYKAATDEQNEQVVKLREIIKKYDENAYITGEGALTKDLVEIADIDFKRVSFISILAIFVIILILFASISVPVLLVGVIELAIFINMAIPYYMGTVIPFIASIVIGSIQLGATVDYAILLTTRFREELRNGHDKYESMRITLKSSAKSIVTSALTFFGSTVGVGFIAKIEMIRSLSMMIARGAIISMFAILFLLPAVLLVSEGVISATSKNWRTRPRLKVLTKGRN
ncbi:efflux RND transporter permease subunit [Caloranaerobacter ferrireducens]|uniref:efflux RND transporter permease subunit n=1 Tax=Caloranaerobacter ferrireducens TaxID=1323370 RepID=UPI000A93DFA5|nr:MMPL family transporter [Caloranaerobacter ferrireducens]